jgi:hypothetical protein
LAKYVPPLPPIIPLFSLLLSPFSLLLFFSSSPPLHSPPFQKDKQISKFLAKQLKKSTSRDPAFINALLHVSFEDPKIGLLEPELISDVSLASGNYHMGIMLLEKMILILNEIKKCMLMIWREREGDREGEGRREGSR